jgi:hypothetical protein
LNLAGLDLNLAGLDLKSRPKNKRFLIFSVGLDLKSLCWFGFEISLLVWI